jgi:acyl-coenzyme A synthetase/AMP-(fatty) acid ligase
MRKSGAHRLLTTHATQQDSLRNLKVELMSDVSSYDVAFEEAPGLREVFPKLGNETLEDPFEPYPPPFTRYPDREDVVAILHSSGSTGFPKAIPVTAEVVYLNWGRACKLCFSSFSPGFLLTR